MSHSLSRRSLCLGFIGLGTVSKAFAAPPAENAPPRVFLEEAPAVARVHARIKAGDKAFDAALAALGVDADKQMTVGPYSVMDKKVAPPSGDKHDYLSQGIYFWPDPTKPNGLPYINRDGQINPEVRKITDESELVALRRAIPTLAQAYYFTGEEKYAARAALLLRTWFLDPKTRMNPHFKYTQFVPGVAPEGRYSGIVDGESFIPIMDAIGFLDGSPSWTRAEEQGLTDWAGQFCDWLLTSKPGQQESRSPNNHGTVYDALVASLALRAGKTDVARRVLEAVKQKRITGTIEPDGAQPTELRRTKAWTYANKNLMNLFWLASMGETVGIDLWNYQSPDGRSLRSALDFLLPFAGAGGKPWPYKEISHKAGTPLPLQSSFLRRAAIKMHEPKYEALLSQLAPNFDQGTFALLCPRP